MSEQPAHLTVKLLTPHRKGCDGPMWRSYRLSLRGSTWSCTGKDCDAEVEVTALAMDCAIAEALEEK